MRWALGCDFPTEGAALLDTTNAKLERRPIGDLPAAWSTRPAVDYDDVEGQIIAPATLDATPVRLMLDTGSPDILWLGQMGPLAERGLEGEEIAARSLEHVNATFSQPARLTA